MEWKLGVSQTRLPPGALPAQEATLGTIPCNDSYIKLAFLRSRWYSPAIGRFTTRDEWPGSYIKFPTPTGGGRFETGGFNTEESMWPDYTRPQTLNGWSYVEGNPINRIDPSGHISELEKFYVRTLYDLYIKDTASRLNVSSLTNLSSNAFAAMIAAKILVEDATVYADTQPAGILREVTTIPPSVLRDWARDQVENKVFGGEISWGPANIPLPLAIQNLAWWEQNHACLGLEFEDVHTDYYSARQRNWLERLFLGSENTQLVWELQTGEGAVQGVGLAILQSSSRARQYWSNVGQPLHELSAYSIALGINQFRETDTTLYTVSGWTAKGSQWDWVEAIDDAGAVLGFTLATPTDYLPYTDEERQKLDGLP